MDTRQRTIEQILAILVLGLLIAGCFVVLRPFVSALMWAIILCFATWPIYTRMEARLGGRRTLAAGLMTLSIALVLLAPFVIIALSLADDVTQFAGRIRGLIEAGAPDPPAWVEKVPLGGGKLREYWESLAGDRSKLVRELKRLVQPATSWLIVVAGQLAGGLVELGMSVFIAFFLFRDGPSAAGQLTRAIERLGGDKGRQLLDVAARTVRGVVYGILGTALVQAVVAGIGFAIAGVPGAGFLALLTFIVSVVPVGAPLVWIPAAIWLFASGWIGWGVFMVVWGVLVSSIDNVVKPLIIRQGSQIPFILILFGVLGGAMSFGFIGVFIGPTLLAVGFRMLEWWNAGRRALTDASSATSSQPVGAAL